MALNWPKSDTLFDQSEVTKVTALIAKVFSGNGSLLRFSRFLRVLAVLCSFSSAGMGTQSEFGTGSGSSDSSFQYVT